MSEGFRVIFAGMLILMGGQGIAQNQFNAFSRVQEATADQIAVKLLDKTHQSSRGLLSAFNRLADEEARASRQQDAYASDHPMGRERGADLRVQLAPPATALVLTDGIVVAGAAVESRVLGIITKAAQDAQHRRLFALWRRDFRLGSARPVVSQDASVLSG